MKKSIKKKTEEIEQLGDEIKNTLKKNSSKDQQEKLIEAITLAGAVAFVLYALLKMLFSKKKAKKKKSYRSSSLNNASSEETGLGKMIKDQFFIILTSIVREQLQKHFKNSNIGTNGKGNLHQDSNKEN